MIGGQFEKRRTSLLRGVGFVWERQVCRLGKFVVIVMGNALTQIWRKVKSC